MLVGSKAIAEGVAGESMHRAGESRQVADVSTKSEMAGNEILRPTPDAEAEGKIAGIGRVAGIGVVCEAQASGNVGTQGLISRSEMKQHPELVLIQIDAAG